MSLYYKDYLQLDKILDAQQPKTFLEGQEPRHEEMLFIVIHQTYELWFKQVLFEVSSVLKIMDTDIINDNTSELSNIVHRLKRVVLF